MVADAEQHGKRGSWQRRSTWDHVEYVRFKTLCVANMMLRMRLFRTPANEISATQTRLVFSSLIHHTQSMLLPGTQLIFNHRDTYDSVRAATHQQTVPSGVITVDATVLMAINSAGGDRMVLPPRVLHGPHPNCNPIFGEPRTIIYRGPIQRRNISVSTSCHLMT